MSIQYCFLHDGADKKKHKTFLYILPFFRALFYNLNAVRQIYTNDFLHLILDSQNQILLRHQWTGNVVSGYCQSLCSRLVNPLNILVLKLKYSWNRHIYHVWHLKNLTIIIKEKLIKKKMLLDFEGTESNSECGLIPETI